MKGPLVHASDRRRASEGGFSLAELLVSLAITLIILGLTFSVMVAAQRSSEAARGVTTMNASLRMAMDLVVRDFIQVGPGLPAGKVISVPSGPGALPVRRPGPPGTTLTFGDTTSLSAVTPGPGLGPSVNGVTTDLITTLYADPAFDNVPLAALGASSMTVVSAVNITDGGANDVRVGDLIMLVKGAATTLLSVTSVSGQVVTFGTDDALRLNQYDASLAMLGTLDRLRAMAPPDVIPLPPAAQEIPTRATRVRMVTYYLDTAADPQTPRLMRRIGAGTPRAVAFAIENLQYTYDLADGVTNPANVRMTATDLGGGGACSPSPCSPNQIRKVNVFLAGRSRARFAPSGDFFRNTLVSQVSLRNLAFVDRYR
jgi:type II secretory pathway pseudopilin PulG